MPGSTQTSTLSYFHHDHLGSIAAITDENRNIVERLAYDPWGKRRYPDGASDISDSLLGKRTDRGYTEHEHLDEMGIIHMNGRVYDPLIGRMMSADPNIQAPYNLKSFNRYSYVWNNPLKMFDPTGFDAEDTDPDPPGTVPVTCAGNCTTNITTRDLSGPVNNGTSFTQGLQNLANAIGNGLNSLFGGGNSSAFNADFRGYPDNGELVACGPVCAGVIPLIPYVPWAIGGYIIYKNGPAMLDAGARVWQAGGDFVNNVFNTSGTENKDAVTPKPDGAGTSAAAGGSPDPDNDGGDKKSCRSVNQINNDVKRDRAPDGIKRADTGKVTGEQDHVHFDNGNALNRDGTWKHVNSTDGLTRSQSRYLIDSGWKLP